MTRTTTVLASLLLVSCGSASGRPIDIAPREGDELRPAVAAGDADEDPPLGRLPADVRPSHCALALTIVPSRERFAGSARIRVDFARPRSLIWLHGKDLEVSEATVTPEGGEPIVAVWEQVDEQGVAALRLPRSIGPGPATIAITYTAAFDRRLRGLYRVDADGESYAFTQFEPISARLAFPGFDEPAFKIPFDVTLVTQRDHVALGNTPAIEEAEAEGGLRRTRFAATEPIPTYLVAWAVGPLDVVEAPPIPPNDVRSRPVPFRGVAVRGRGARLAYAMERTPAILAELESYFGTEYPYPKLDIVAVPDFGSGAMENVGLVTFREQLLLLDERAPEWQRRGYAYVMAHELAHQWFGNLVTMPWWDDIWLNEAFATWMGNKIVRALHPEYQAGVSFLDGVQGAMRQDSMVSARQIRQPILSSHDIRNAFDGITYSKGGGVLEMFERWLGVETFRDGIRRYLASHRHGTATADDLLSALSEAGGRDVGTPFRTFLEQAGLPMLEARVECGDDGSRLRLRQSRYLPVGSTGDRARSWRIPVCIRYRTNGETKESCSLVEETDATIALEGACPSWVMPNADAAGYFRFALATEDLGRLRRDGWAELTPRERLAVADSLRAAFESASTPLADLLQGIEPIARSEIRSVSSMPMGLVSFTREHLVEEAERAAVERYAQRLYQPVMRRLGWRARPGDQSETRLYRAEVAGFLALTARDPRARAEAARRGRAYVGFGGDGRLHPEAVEPDLAGSWTTVAVQDGDAELFEAVLALALSSDDALVRERLLHAVCSTRDPALGRRALALVLDERLRVNEATWPLEKQSSMPETRDAAWDFLRENIDAIVARISTDRAAYLPGHAAGFCSEERAAEVEAFFRPRIDSYAGGPRNLARALEAIRLCAARAAAHRESARGFF